MSLDGEFDVVVLALELLPLNFAHAVAHPLGAVNKLLGLLLHKTYLVLVPVQLRDAVAEDFAGLRLKLVQGLLDFEQNPLEVTHPLLAQPVDGVLAGAKLNGDAFDEAFVPAEASEFV